MMRGSRFMPIGFRAQPSASPATLQSVDTQLDALGLSVKRIESQNLEVLTRSLNLVEQFIAHPDSLKTLRIRYSRTLGYYFYQDGLVLSFDGVLRPILVNFRSLIIGRLETLRLDEGIQALKESLKEADDEQLTQKLEGLKASSQSLGEKLIENSKEQEYLLQREREKLTLFEGRFRLFRSLLEKEAAATLIGMLFLIIALLIWTADMFTTAEAPAVLKDCLFLVFGYFFGQATTQSTHME